MGSELDPAEAELAAILNAANFHDARVLEIGSGDGRLTFRYAEHSKCVFGIDPKLSETVKAVRNCPTGVRKRVRFLCASATALPFPEGAFGLTLLASAL